MKTFIYLLIVFFGLNLCNAQDWNMYPYNPAGQIVFPLDEGHHTADPTEWWYTSGHVVGDNSGTNYSFMCTFFYNPASVFDGFRILNITNDDTGEFFQSVLPLNYTVLSQTECDIEANIFQSGTEYFITKRDMADNLIPFEYELFSNGGSGVLDISFQTTKRPLILSEDGFLEQGTASYTYYYSQTMNIINGDLTFNGVTEPVSGTGWIDRQYGDFNPFFGERYEWFSVQLSNGMDINFWNVFSTNRTVPNNERYRLLSAYVDENNQYSSIDLTIERLEYFCIEERCYSKKWHLTSPTNAIDLIIETLHTTGEVQLPFQFFEGATSISGTVNGVDVTGKGFAELLHYYENPDVTFASQQNGFYNPQDAITWDLNNPDDGRPVYYDLEYSTDNEMTYLPIVQDLVDADYTWNTSSLTNGQNIWFKLTARSIDGTLTSTVVNEVQVDLTLTNEDFENRLGIKLFPNPVTSQLNINFSDVLNTVNYNIIDLSGRVIKTGRANTTNQLSVSTREMQSGLYTIQIIAPNSESVLKFIKL